MKTQPVVIFLILLTAALPASAGHGLMNSFNDIEWLPHPGYTPADRAYPLERLRERVALLLAGEQRLVMTLEFAREKLSEANAMVRAEQTGEAWIAAGLYNNYLERAARELNQSESIDPGERELFISTLYEHLYIVSIEYTDMPLDIREQIFMPVIESASFYIDQLKQQLSEGERKALFFKDEEIRWGLEMMKQADKQRITN